MVAIRRPDEIGCGDAPLTGDVVVVGAGVSGLAFAFRAAKAGRRVLVIEREPGRVGGCLHSHRLSDGFWFELGAHGAYATYGGFVEMAMATGAGLLERGRARGRFGVGAAGAWRWSGPAGLVSRLRWLDVALHFPSGLLAGKTGRSVEEYYSALLGPRNFRELVSPLFAMDDLFYSAVTRDVFPDARWRAFAFHFEAGRATRDEKLRGAAAALGVKPSEFACAVEARRTLPSPRLGHHEIVREITAALDGQRLAITGNYFDGLAIEDCVQRSFGEWARVARDGVRA